MCVCVCVYVYIVATAAHQGTYITHIYIYIYTCASNSTRSSWFCVKAAQDYSTSRPESKNQKELKVMSEQRIFVSPQNVYPSRSRNHYTYRGIDH